MLTQALRRGGGARFLIRLRFQLLGALVVALVLPLLVNPFGNFASLASQTTKNSMTASFVAITLGFYFYRRLSIFPGINIGFYVFPTFGATFGVISLIMFLLRLDYSRLYLTSSFTLVLLWFFAVTLAVKRNVRFRLAIVPIGDANRVKSLSGVDWLPLRRPVQVPNIHGLVADLRADMPDEWEKFIADTALTGVPVFHVKQIVESLSGRAEIEHLSENTLGSLNPNQAYLKIKQAADWCAALVCAVVFFPLFAVVALAIKWDSSGPVLFLQERMGYQGHTFRVCKFRTMRDEARTTRGPGSDSALEEAITRKQDDRITRVGVFLRRTRIDELPQILNILRGEMSWIGPRPEALVLSQWYESELPFYRYRHIVRPGITGWAQVTQGHVAQKDEVLEKLHYDFFYIKNFSAWLDVLILLRTVRTVLTGFGAK